MTVAPTLQRRSMMQIYNPGLFQPWFGAADCEYVGLQLEVAHSAGGFKLVQKNNRRLVMDKVMIVF